MKVLLKKITPLRWLDTLPWVNIIFIAVLAGIVPIVPEPHLVEKIKMFFLGTLSKPIDIFDLLMHASPLLLIAIKGFRQIKSSDRLSSGSK